MTIYKVTVYFASDEEVEADSEEEAFQIARRLFDELECIAADGRVSIYNAIRMEVEKAPPPPPDDPVPDGFCRIWNGEDWEIVEQYKGSDG